MAARERLLNRHPRVLIKDRRKYSQVSVDLDYGVSEPTDKHQDNMMQLSDAGIEKYRELILGYGDKVSDPRMTQLEYVVLMRDIRRFNVLIADVVKEDAPAFVEDIIALCKDEENVESYHTRHE